MIRSVPTLMMPVWLRAIVTGLLIAMVAANVWPLLLLSLGVPIAAVAEAVFLTFYIWWAGGGGPPRSSRRRARMRFAVGQVVGSTAWVWGLVAAIFFAITIHASIVLLFRLVPFPAASFRHGYDFSFIPTVPLRWIAVVASAASAGICEETGFRGYMQRPIEQRHGVTIAILVSSVFFTALHLTKDWATIGMVPVVFGAGVLLGLLAWASQSAGVLHDRPLHHGCRTIRLLVDLGSPETSPRGRSERAGVDQSFMIACAVFAISLAIVLLTIRRLSLRA